MPRVLIDTCGWIDFLRPASGALTDIVENLLATDNALMCSVSVTELLQGAKGKKETQQLDMLFATVPILSIEDSDWQTAGLTLQALRAKGITVPLTDALIATAARRHNVPVLTIDAHFEHLGVAQFANRLN